MDLLKPLIALLAIVNPIGAMPFFLHFTQNLRASSGGARSASRRSAPSSSSPSVRSPGLQIIEFFGISIASFQVGGGLLLLISSMNMLNAQQAESRSTDVGDGQRQGRRGRLDRDRAADDPAAHRPGDDLDDGHLRREDAHPACEHAVLVGYGVVIGAGDLRRFGLAGRIASLLGRTGINVMTRLMGLILAAMAVELLPTAC